MGSPVGARFNRKSPDWIRGTEDLDSNSQGHLFVEVVDMPHLDSFGGIVAVDFLVFFG